MANKKSQSSSQHQLVLCDLNFSRLQSELIDLETSEFNQVEDTIVPDFIKTKSAIKVDPSPEPQLLEVEVSFASKGRRQKSKR